jgi:hypothetical protein
MEVLGEHVARLEIGHYENLRAPSDRRFDAFDLRRLRADGVIERKRSVEYAAGDLSALGHLAKCGGLDGPVPRLRSRPAARFRRRDGRRPWSRAARLAPSK